MNLFFTIAHIFLVFHFSMVLLYRWNNSQTDKNKRDRARLWISLGFLSFAVHVLLTDLGISNIHSSALFPLSVSCILVALNEIVNRTYTYYLPIAVTLAIVTIHPEILTIYTVVLTLFSIIVLLYIGIRYKINEVCGLGIYLLSIGIEFLLVDILSVFESQSIGSMIIIFLRLMYTFFFIHKKITFFKEGK